MVDPTEVATVFPGLTDAHRRQLMPEIEVVNLAAGALLFREGDPSDGFYAVRSGTLEVLVASASGALRRLATLSPGELVGEMAVLHGAPRSATVAAVEDASLLKFPSAMLERLFASDPSIRSQLTAEADRRLPSLYLATVSIFSGLDADALRELDVAASWVRLTGGEALFREGDTADDLYVLVRGRLEVIVGRGEAAEQVAGQLGRGAVVGEVAFLTGQPRTATVRAIRDSELVRLSHEALRRLVARHPDGALEMLRVLAGRVRPTAAPPRDTLVSTIAIVPAGSERLPAGWTERFVQALTAIAGPTLHVSPDRIDQELGPGVAASLDRDAAQRQVAGWLHSREDQFRYVVFDCDTARAAWSELCLRQADLVLLVAAAQSEPVVGALHRRLFAGELGGPSALRELVLLHPPSTARPTGTGRWLSAYPVSRHHHVRLDRSSDLARVARFVAGKCVSVAFSGGGARALGHIGVVRALNESGIPIDAVAGVSAGCFAPAFYAMGHDPAAMVAISNDSVGRYNALREATFPMVSFLSGRKSVEMLRGMFDVEIENLWFPFICLSTNLTRAEVVVHERGSLWRAIRASTSVPGVSPPVCVGGELLVDGGVLNNLPADVLRARYGGTVIAVDVSQAVELTTDAGELAAISGWPLVWSRLRRSGKAPALPHIFEILLRTATLSSVHHGAAMAQNADLYMRLPVAGVPTLDWKAGPALVDRCYQFALGEIATWKQSSHAYDAAARA